jgi:hypothetical protein
MLVARRGAQLALVTGIFFAAQQQPAQAEVPPTCDVFCAITAATCLYVHPGEFCLGWLEGCVLGCQAPF